eukprot:5728369-Pyramimonas_sp.AAC.1
MDDSRAGNSTGRHRAGARAVQAERGSHVDIVTRGGVARIMESHEESCDPLMLSLRGRPRRFRMTLGTTLRGAFPLEKF